MVSQFGGGLGLTCVGWVEQSETQQAPIRWVSATASTQPTRLGLD